MQPIEQNAPITHEEAAIALVNKKRKEAAEEAHPQLGDDGLIEAGRIADQQMAQPQGQSQAQPQGQQVDPQSVELLKQLLAQTQKQPQGNAIATMPKMLPADNLVSSAQVTPEGNIKNSGFFANIFGTSTATLLDQLTRMSEIEKNRATAQYNQGAPQREARLITQEERRLRQEAATNFKQQGGVVTEDDMSNGLSFAPGADISSTIEAYGIPAQIDKKSGKRTWSIPPSDILKQRAAQMRISVPEEDHFNNIKNTLDTITEIKKDLAKLGIKNPDALGSASIPEGFLSDLGPVSIPARFNLAGQYAKDPQYTAVKAKIERLFQQYRKIVTGAQASYTELAVLRPLIMSMTQRPGVFFSQLGDLENETMRMMDNRLGSMEAIGRDTRGLRKMLGQDVRTYEVNAPADDPITRLGLDPNRYEIVKPTKPVRK